MYMYLYASLYVYVHVFSSKFVCLFVIVLLLSLCFCYIFYLTFIRTPSSSKRLNEQQQTSFNVHFRPTFYGNCFISGALESIKSFQKHLNSSISQIGRRCFCISIKSIIFLKQVYAFILLQGYLHQYKLSLSLYLSLSLLCTFSSGIIL